MKCTELAKCRKPFSPLENPHMAGLLRRAANKLPKLDVAGSTPVARSTISLSRIADIFMDGLRQPMLRRRASALNSAVARRTLRKPPRTRDALMKRAYLLKIVSGVL